MKRLILATLILVGCGGKLEHPLVIKSKEINSHSIKEPNCVYQIKNLTWREDSWFEAPCSKWNTGDTLK